MEDNKEGLANNYWISLYKDAYVEMLLVLNLIIDRNNTELKIKEANNRKQSGKRIIRNMRKLIEK